MEYNKKSVRLPKNKKWLALFLTICMIFSMMPMSSMEAYAAAAGNGTDCLLYTSCDVSHGFFRGNLIPHAFKRYDQTVHLMFFAIEVGVNSCYRIWFLPGA